MFSQLKFCIYFLLLVLPTTDQKAFLDQFKKVENLDFALFDNVEDFETEKENDKEEVKNEDVIERPKNHALNERPNDNTPNERPKDNALATVDEYHKPQEKRWLTAVLTGLAVLGFATMATSNIIGIIATATQCCGVGEFKEICEKKEKYTETVEDFDQFLEKVNENYVNLKNLGEVIDSTYYALDRVYTRMNNLDTAGEHVILSLDSELYEVEHNLTSEVLAELQSADSDFDFNLYISDKYNTAYTSLLVDLYKLKSFYITPTYYLVYPILKRFFLTRLQSQAQSTGTHGFSRFLSLFTQSTKLRAAATWIKNNPVTISVIKGAVTAVMIGLDAYSLYYTLNECQKLLDEIDGHIDEVKKAKANVTITNDEITVVYENYTAYYAELKAEAMTDELIEYLTELIEIAGNSTYVTDRLAEPALVIQDYIDSIESADYYTTIDLLNKLDQAVHIYTLVYTCYAAKFEILSFMYDSCSEGSTLTLEDHFLSQTALMNETCDAFEYMNESTAVAAATELLYYDDFFQSCVFNMDVTQDFICGQKAEGYSGDEIYKDYYSVTNQTEFDEIYNACANVDITPQVESTIALYKGSGIRLSDVLSSLPIYNATQVESTYNESAYANMTNSKKADVCDYVAQGMSLDTIYYTYYTAYLYSDVETAYNECLSLTDADKYLICIVIELASDSPSLYLSEMIERVGNDTVFEYYNNHDCETVLGDENEDLHETKRLIADKKKQSDGRFDDEDLKDILDQILGRKPIKQVKKDSDDDILSSYHKIMKSTSGSFKGEKRRFSEMKKRRIENFKQNIDKVLSPMKDIRKIVRKQSRDMRMKKFKALPESVSAMYMNYICHCANSKQSTYCDAVYHDSGLSRDQIKAIQMNSC